MLIEPQSFKNFAGLIKPPKSYPPSIVSFSAAPAGTMG
jgi:hypothetical protein